MIASAPGKLVLSGAYVVLDGAPAVVTAVDRRAVADASRRAEFVGPELRAAFGQAAVPYVDSGALRAGGRKLGLGSSAAALVAALGARRLALGLGLDEAALDEIAAEAYEAHRAAQGGGSGVDVLASTYGGTLVCEARPSGPPAWRRGRLPAGLVIEAWGCPESASTASLLGPVRELRRAEPGRYRALTGPAFEGAVAVAGSLDGGDVAGCLRGLDAQAEAMEALGEAAGVPILPGYLRELRRLRAPGSVVAQSGAGGGDIAIHAATAPSDERWRREAEARGLVLLSLACDAPGLRAEAFFQASHETSSAAPTTRPGAEH